MPAGASTRRIQAGKLVPTPTFIAKRVVTVYVFLGQRRKRLAKARKLLVLGVVQDHIVHPWPIGSALAEVGLGHSSRPNDLVSEVSDAENGIKDHLQVMARRRIRSEE